MTTLDDVLAGVTEATQRSIMRAASDRYRRAYEAKAPDFGKLRNLLTASERNALDDIVIHGRKGNPAACRRGLRVISRESRT